MLRDELGGYNLATVPAAPPSFVMRNGCFTSCMIRGQPRTSQLSQVKLSIKENQI